MVLCPSDETPWYQTCSYAANIYPVRVNDVDDSRRLDDFSTPSRTSLYMDMSEFGGATGVGQTEGTVLLNPYVLGARHIAMRHHTSANVLFLDQHVGTLREEFLPEPTWQDPFWGRP